MRNLLITFLFLLSIGIEVFYSNSIHHERIERIISGSSSYYPLPDVIIDPLFDQIPY